MKLRRLFTSWVAAAVLPFMGGCNTYIQQKADVLAGGPERRVQAAEERRQAAEDSRQGLEGDREALEEELALQDQQIASLDRRLEDQDARIAQAGRENRITREREQAMREKIGSLDREVRDLELRLQAARLAGDPGTEKALEERLETLETQVRAVNEEIDLLMR